MLKSSLIYVLLGFLPVAANFLLAPLYTHYLSPEAYAVIGVGTLFQTFLTFFISLSLDGAFSRFYFTYASKPRLLHAQLSTILVATTLTSVLIFGALYAGGETLFTHLFANPDFTFKGLGIWVILTTYANVVYLLFTALYRNAENVGRFALCSILFFVAPVVGTLIGLIYFKAGPRGAIIGRAIGSMLVVVVLLALYYGRRPIVFKKRFLKGALKYSLPLIPYQIMFAGFSNLDRIILERSFSAGVFGIYNFAISISALVLVFLTAVSNVLTPRMYKEMAANGDEEKVRLLNFAMVYSITAVVCLGISGLVPAMRLFIGAAYAPSYSYIGTLFLSYLPYLHYLVVSLPLFFFGKTKVFPVVSFAALAAGLLFDWLFVSHLGVWAVCLSLYIIRVVQAIVGYAYARKYGYASKRYVDQKRSLIGSAIIIALYNAALGITLAFDTVDIAYVNLVPLAAFIGVSLLLYRPDLKRIWWQLRHAS